MGNRHGVCGGDDKPSPRPPRQLPPHLCLCFASHRGADKLFLAGAVLG